MSKWQRLSGYLHTKPTGPFKRLKGSQRQWHVFEESSMTVRVFRNEDEASSLNKEPLRVISIANAVLYIDTSEFNQFVIYSDGKENVLQAETEEAMLLWLDTLQARRNEAIRNDPKSALNGEPTTLAERRKAPRMTIAKMPTAFMRQGTTVSFDVNEIQCNSAKSTTKAWRISQTQPAASNSSSPIETTPSPLTRSLSHVQSVPQFHQSCTTSGVSDRGFPMSDALRIGGSEMNLLAATQSSETATLHGTDSEGTLEDGSTEDFTQQPLIVSTTDHVPDKLKAFSISPKISTPRPGNHVQLGSNWNMNALLIDNVAFSVSSAPDLSRENPPNEVDANSKTERNSDETRENSPEEMTKPHTLVRTESNSSGSSANRSSRSSQNSQHTPIRTEDSMPGSRQEPLLIAMRELQSQLEASQEREAWLRHLLSYREAAMAELDQRIGLLEDTEEKPSELSIPVGASCATLRTMLRDMEKKQRVLNSKLQFLVTEVRDLATIRQMLTDHGAKQARYTKKLTAEVLRWKQDYVKLLESCIAAFQIDPSQGLMFSDYGRNKFSMQCKSRLAELLEDARRKDPTLPSLNKPISEKYHVDIYGFKQSYTNEAALMHYACRHLYEFFIRQRAGDDNLTSQWTEIMKNPTRELFREELKNLCRAGVPANLRSGVWRMLIHGELKQTILDKGPHYYDRLISEISESKIATKYRKQIALDLLRTMPNNIQFDGLEAPGIQKLQEILQAYSIHNPEVGYCQGMNFLVAVALIFLSKEDAFWCLTAILERYLPEKYFNYGLISAQVDQLVLKDLLSSKLPKLFEHIQKMEIDISAITLNWFLAIFYDSVPFETLVRIWDIFLLEGSKCLFRFAMALLKRNEEMLLQQTDTISFWKCLKAASRITYDADSLVQTAYEELKPFVSRSTILSLQSHHYEILNKEMTEKQRLWQKVFKEVSEERMEEPMVMMRRRKCNTDRVCVQAATSFKDEQVWICYGGKFHSQLVQVRVNDNRMAQVGFELDTRVSCIRALNNEILLVGMMSDKLCAYSIETKEMLWQLPLHDIITDIVVAEWPHEHMNRVFAGLGNGELLVIENASVNEPKDSMFIFTIGFTRVSSLLLMDNQLWCACSHSVYVFNTATLDYQLHFNISDNALDLISTMKSSAYGVWIAVRGSPVIELWNPKTYSRLLLFNTCTEAYLDYREEDEGTFHVQRVTALLPYENTIWIGTGNGDVIVFEIIDESLQGKATSPFQSESDLANPSVAMNEVRAHSSNGSANVSTADSYQDVQSLAAEQTYCSLPNRHTKKHDQHVTFRTNKVGSGIDEPNTEGPATSMYNVGKLDLNAEAKRINFRKVDSEPTVTWADNRAESAPCLLQTSSNADGYSINVDLAEPRTEPIMSAQSPLDSTPHTYSPDILLQNVMQHLDDCISDSPEQSTSPVYQDSDSKSPGQETNEMNGQAESNDFADKDEPSLSHSNQSLSNLDQNGSRDLTKISLTASMKSESVASSPSNYFHDCQSTGSDDCSPVLPVPNPMFCPLRRHSRLIEPKADRKLPRLQLQPMLRNKVSETPIRLFVTQRNKDGERVIISCATYFNDDDAVLKWHRCKTETMMWSNQPILYYDAVSQQVHFPAYMLNTMRMRRDSSRRITIAT